MSDKVTDYYKEVHNRRQNCEGRREQERELVDEACPRRGGQLEAAECPSETRLHSPHRGAAGTSACLRVEAGLCRTFQRLDGIGSRGRRSAETKTLNKVLRRWHRLSGC